MIKVVDGGRSVAWPLEADVGVDPAGDDVLAGGVDGPGAPGDDQVVAHHPDDGVLESRGRLEASLLL